MSKVSSRIFVCTLLFLSWFQGALGQPTLPADLKKPKKFENKTLGSEKSAEKKFTRWDPKNLRKKNSRSPVASFKIP